MIGRKHAEPSGDAIDAEVKPPRSYVMLSSELNLTWGNVPI